METADLALWRQVAVISLLAAGMVGCTLGVAGMARLPDVYGRIHAAGKTLVLGVVSVLLAGVFLGGTVAARSLLTAAFVLVSMPLTSHVLARRRYRQRRGGPEPVEETPPLTRPGPASPPEEEGG